MSRTESSLGVITDAPPHTALTVLMPSIVMPLPSSWPPALWICGAFSIPKMPAELLRDPLTP